MVNPYLIVRIPKPINEFRESRGSTVLIKTYDFRAVETKLLKNYIRFY